MRSARAFFRLNLAFGALGALGTLGGSVVALQHVRLTFGPVHGWLLTCGHFLLPHLTLGHVAVLGLGLLGAAALVRGVRSATRQVRATRRTLRAITVTAEHELAGERVLIIAGTTSQAFCMGVVRPRIYLSRIVLERLGTSELHAVIAHEAHHARHRDPLRLAVLSVMADALFFLPALTWLRRRYQELAEVAADEAAVTAVKSTATLAAALLQFDDGSVAGTVGVAAERVDHLLGVPPHLRWPVSMLAGTVAIVGGLFAVVLLAGSAAPGRVSLSALAMQSCMIAMVLVPLLLGASLAIAGRRVLATNR